MNSSRRRHVVGLLTLGAGLELSLSAQSVWASTAEPGPELVAVLQKGGCAFMLRHAQTESGVGDPPSFRLGNCSTQRNLSAEGRAQAGRMKRWFELNRLRASHVRSSGWCRCLDTAELAFGSPTVFPALNSTFDNPGQQAEQTRTLRAALKTIPAGQFEVWVTHQVNISALTGQWASTGEAFVVGPHDSGAAVMARRHFT